MISYQQLPTGVWKAYLTRNTQVNAVGATKEEAVYNLCVALDITT